MILEAFAQYLQSAEPTTPAPEVLVRWLWEKLSVPPENNVDKVIHTEIGYFVASRKKGAGAALLPELTRHKFDKGAFGEMGATYIFKSNSPSGKRLLKSLYEYSLSFEQQRWARWIHGLKASDFNRES